MLNWWVELFFYFSSPSFHQHQDHFLFLPTLPPTPISELLLAGDSFWGVCQSVPRSWLTRDAAGDGVGGGREGEGDGQWPARSPAASFLSFHPLLSSLAPRLCQHCPWHCAQSLLPCHLSWTSWGLSPLGPLVDSVTCGFSRWPWSARIFGCALFYSLDHPLSLHPAESHTASKPSSSSDFFNEVIFNFHRKDLNVQWRFVLICSLLKGEDLTCGTSLMESPFIFWSSSLRLKCFPWVMICWMLRDSLDLGCYWVLLEWMCHSDEITTWQFYKSFLSSFFDHYSRRCKFNSQPVYRQT